MPVSVASATASANADEDGEALGRDPLPGAATRVSAMRERTIQGEAFAKRLGRNLYRARVAADLTQDELAYMVGMHRTEVSNIERGLRIPRSDTLMKIAHSLEAGYDEVFAGLSWRPARPQAGSMEVDPG